MLKKLSLWILIKSRINRRFRLSAAFLFAFFLITAFLFFLPSVAPRYLFTLGDRFSVLTPRSFRLGQLYDFNTIANSYTIPSKEASDQNELVLPRPDNRTIIFKYPEVVALGRPTFLGNEIAQSVDFTVKNPPATGLIQIWVLNISLDDFLTASKNYSTIEYLSFETKKEKKDELNYTLWDYTFMSQENKIHALEAFFDDPPYMYRISIFAEDKNFSEELYKVFNDIVRSVTVK